MTEKMLITADQINPLEIFVEGKYDSLLDFIKAESAIEKPTVKTKKGRDLIRSTAAKIASSKVFVEKYGKELADSEREKIKQTLESINQSRNFIKDALIYHQAVVRKPLTDYETAEKAKEEAQLLKIQIGEDHAEAIEHNQFLIDKKAVEDDKKKVEAARLQLEADERAKQNAENIQTQKQEDETRKRIEAEQEMERLKQKAIDDANQAEIDKGIAVKLAEQKAADEAKRIEHDRIVKETEKRKAAEENAANVVHRKQINNEALEDLTLILESMELPENCQDSSHEMTKQIIIAIIEGRVRNVTVNY